MKQMRKTVPLALALSVGLFSGAWAGPGDLNSTNTGENVQGGQYFNTPGSRTTFVNNSGPLHVRSGQLVRGLESDAAKIPNGNGGTMYFRAPNNVIRIDGTIDVSAVRDGSVYLGNGGKAFFDSAYLFQNGNIFANGVNGGVVQFNVGGMTVGPNAKTTAQGFGGNGGTINVNSPGVVDIQRGAILDTSGKVVGTYDTNVINVIGGLVNVDGIVQANGVAGRDYKANNGDAALISANPNLRNNPVPGDINGGEGTGEILFGPPLDFMPNPATTTRGGTIRLVATGQTIDSTDVVGQSSVFSNSEKGQLNGRLNSLRYNDGGVWNEGIIQANGAYGKDGGTILVSAADDVHNRGLVQVNGDKGLYGGDGGTIGMLAMDTIENKGLIEANGGSTTNPYYPDYAGDGGLIGFSYGRMNNASGLIRANGYNGGLIAFSGSDFPPGLEGNPMGFGIVQAAGLGGAGGVILVPDLDKVPDGLWMKSATFGLPDGAQQASLLQSRNNELLLHKENGLLLSQDNGLGALSTTFTGRLSDATIRTVEQPLGWSVDPVEALKHKSNIVIGSTNPNPLTMDFDNANIAPLFSRPTALMVVNNGDVTNDMHWSPGVMLVGSGSHDTVFAPGGGHLSILSNGDITNNGFLLTRGLWSGGVLNLAATGDIVNNKVILNTAFNKDLASAFAPNPGYISSHTGSSILKAGNNLVNNYRLNSYLSFYDIHPPLNRPGLIWPNFLNGGQIGANNYLQAGNQIINGPNGHIGSDAIVYRNGLFGTENPSNAIGGVLTLDANNGVIDNGNISATGRAYYGFDDGRMDDGPRFPSDVTYDNLHEVESTDGDIVLK